MSNLKNTPLFTLKKSITGQGRKNVEIQDKKKA